MVGASLAVALAPLGFRVALIEAIRTIPPRNRVSMSAPRRCRTAAAESWRRWECGATFERAATPIRKIHVSDQGRFGFARIDAAEQGLEAMGYVVPNRALGAALWSRLQESRGIQRLLSRAGVERRGGAIPCSAGGGNMPDGAAAAPSGRRSVETVRRARIDARLIVAADGVQSAVRGAFGVEAESRDYEQTAVITTVLPQRFHDHVAYERFTDSGPLALLPLEGGRCTLVLTLRRRRRKRPWAGRMRSSWPKLQRRFGFRLGRFLKVGRRSQYPLSLTRAAAHQRGALRHHRQCRARRCTRSPAWVST